MKPSVRLILLSGLWLALQRNVFAEEPFFVGLQGHLPSLKTVQVKSDHVYDYTFSQAPSDWRMQSGKWGMINRSTRIPYGPGWRWFGGHSEEVAAVWNKRKFAGDFSLHVYFSFIEGLEREAGSWRVKSADVGLSFCGDGQNLGSGYALILGADNNWHSVLLRQGRMVVESSAPEAIFPSHVDGELRLPQLRTHWWHAVIDRFDNRIECWLDGKLLFVYDDPQALNEGQVALWTYNNGIVLSRVQLYYENEIRRSFVKNSLPGEPIAPQGVSEPVKADTPAP